MRFHLTALPHTQVTRAYSACAYTQKVLKFANMMGDRGHEVIVYGSEENESSADLVTCITKARQIELGFRGPEDYQGINFDANKPLFSEFNACIIEEMQQRIEPRDFILLSMGTSNMPIIDAFPNHIRVEYGVGYTGIVASTFKVYESYAWRHFVSGVYDTNGQFFDEVIPNYFEVDDFPPSTPEDYFLYMGRLIERKGYDIAVEACRQRDRRLLLAGLGEIPDYGEYRGMVGTEERGTLMAGAIALFCPTLYVGPFEGVSVEANMCGTPVITTDWGSYTENVIEGFNGFRCRSMKDFHRAMDLAESVDRQAIREWTIERFSTDVVAEQYERYFERLNTLWGQGFYE